MHDEGRVGFEHFRRFVQHYGRDGLPCDLEPGACVVEIALTRKTAQEHRNRQERFYKARRWGNGSGAAGNTTTQFNVLQFFPRLYSDR